jgi:hypothetical protein
LFTKRCADFKVGTARCAVRTPQRGVPTKRTGARRVGDDFVKFRSGMTQPARKQLPHGIPTWIDSTTEVYFITVCCRPRGKNQLAKSSVAPALLESIVHRNEQAIWYVRLALLMPDHVHLIVSFGAGQKQMQTVVSKWKEWTAKNL